MRSNLPRRRIGGPARGLVAVLLVCAGPEMAVAQAAGSPDRTAATLSGFVRDVQTESPVTGARLLLHHGDARSLVARADVDSLGAFTFPPLPAGSYVLRIQRIGYRELVEEVLIEAAVRTEITASLVPDAVDLAPVLVTVVRRTPWFMREFERRRALGHGSFVTREEIERIHPQLVSDLFQRVPGIRITRDGRGDQHLTMRGQCIPSIYIDGVATYERISVDLALRPYDVEGIEVYSNATVPVEYASNACGAVLVWTRPPQQVHGRSGWWKPLLIVVGVFGAIGVLR